MSQQDRPQHIQCLVINDLSGDQRVHRVASTLVEAGFRVTALGRELPDSPPLDSRPYACVRLKLPVHQGKWFYILFQLRVLAWLLGKRGDIILANDLDTLLPAFVAKWLTGRKLVYDSHEYFTEVPELIDRPRTRAIWLRLERWLVPKLKQMYTVNESLARIYREAYHIPVSVIRNVPLPYEQERNVDPLRVLIYQGALNVGRGIELMIRAMHHLEEYKLWIVGRGDIEDDLSELVEREKLTERVDFAGFVSLHDLKELTKRARIGFSLEEDLGLNYHYASPNKVYDYIQARVPVIVSDLPEMSRLVREHGVGEVLGANERTPEGLAARVRHLEDAALYEQLVQACDQAAGKLNWEREKASLSDIFQHLE